MHAPASLPAASAPAADGRVLACGTSFGFGPFRVDGAGRLAPAEPSRPPGLTFRWHGRRLHAWLEDGQVSLRVAAGRIPSSSGPAAASRAAAFAAVALLVRELPAGWRVRLLPDHTVLLETTERLDPPPTASALLTCVTCFALALQPYLDVLAEAGVAPTAAFGNVNIWPG